MPQRSLAQQLREVEEAVAGPDRFRDLALVLRRAKTRETLLFAGGVWDRLDKRFLDDSEQRLQLAAVVDLEESQVDFTRWFAEFLADYREGYPRDISLALVAGDRRAGKTFDAYMCQIAALIDVPRHPESLTPAIGWTVSKTFRERDELDVLVSAMIPREWYVAQRAPEHRYTFVHGAILRNLSADDPDSLKQGRVDWLLYNEPQKMQARAIVNGLYGTADRAGLTILAANPPTPADSRGEWMFDLKEKIEDESRAQAQKLQRDPLGIVYFEFSSKDNTKIDQPARRRVGRIAGVIDPLTQEADDGGKWKRPGDKACWEFPERRHEILHKVPKLGLKDITREIASERGTPGDWDFVAGIDFQEKPHIVCVVYRIFGSVDDPTFWAVDELAEDVRDREFTEEAFLEVFGDLADERGYNRSNLLWIGDASSTWQGTRHDFEGDERDSFTVFTGEGWEIIQPQESKNTGKPGRGRNPFVDQRLSLWNELIRRGRYKVDPDRCPWLVQCMREATTKRATGRRRLVANKFAHAIDGATYPTWRLAPRPGGSNRPSPDDVRIVKTSRRKWG